MSQIAEWFLFCVHLVNIAVALYIVKEVWGLVFAGKGAGFAKSLRLGLLVALLFIAVELLYLAKAIDFQVFAISESIFVFILLVLLLQQYMDMRKSLKVNEHFLKRKFLKGKLRDVE
ncbi:MAG: hypothetical protein N3F07_02170 [Candidatus Micrarchaeota archaeon]|nr:hypothetical protein [Candidatus Micrarchaeota archaeon]